MKKMTALLLTAMLLLGLAACGQTAPAETTAAPETTEAAPETTVETTVEATAPETTEAAVCPLEDGVYTAEFDTDSSMFHANESCDGKGTLTVQDGKMTIHVSLVSKTIVNLFPGLAEDAQKEAALLEMAEEIHTLGQAEGVLAGLRELPQVQDYSLRSVDLGSGSVICAIVFPEALFYEILSARAGMPIRSDAQLLQLLTELSRVKQEYDKISDALSAVRATGYGVVMPAAEEMKLETPEIIRKGGAYGVKLKAGAPSIHMVRVDIDTEINPMVGDEKQSQDLVNSLMGEDPEKLWQSNIFGKSVYDLIQEGLTTKLLGMPEEVRGKFRGTLTRIVNEGATGLICLIL